MLKLVRPYTLAFVSTLAVLLASPALAITIEGIEFTDPLVFDIAPGANVTISTSEDLYVYAPNDLLVSTLTIEVGDMIVAADAIQVIGDTISFCAQGICELGPLDLDRDVVIRVFDPIGDVILTAGGSVVLSTQPIPEPSTGLLFASGLLALAASRASARTD